MRKPKIFITSACQINPSVYSPKATNIEMHKFLTIILILKLLSCQLDQAESNVFVGPDLELVQKYDNSGFQSYHTHPEINELSALRILLSSSNKVLAYNFNGNNGNPANVECYDLYDSSGICPTATNERILNRKQINKLINITCDSTTYNGSWSGLAGVCFIPHIGFGFFKNDTLIAQINICFICQGIRTRPYYKSDGLTQIGVKKFYEIAELLNLKIVAGSENLHY
jgi:hypothetical protein